MKEPRRPGDPQFWHSLLLFAVISVAYRFLPGAGGGTEPQGLDWRQATIEGFAPGVTREQIEAVRGPARSYGSGNWEWHSPDLYLERVHGRIRLIGHQLECQGKILACGNRFAVRDLLEALKRADSRFKMPTLRRRTFPALKGNVEACFGQGQVCTLECSPLLSYEDPTDAQGLTFSLTNRNLFFSEWRQAVTSVTWSWPQQAAKR